MKRPTIDLGSGALVDPLKLVNSRALVCGNSGSGKSFKVRRLIEQTMIVSPFPTIVLDRDGDFATLRERFDFALIGEHGEAQAHPETAERLARKLLELGVSAVVDFSDLKLADKLRFVRLFLESMLDAPRSLWRPTLVVLDEAHVFASEDGGAESTQAVIALMDQGRKRGYGGLLTTQRIAKLHKSAYAEANNLFVGRFASDLDLRRCTDLLGFERKDRTVLRDLKPGEFFAMGPAIVDGPRWRDTGVVRFATGPVFTTHPDPENRQEIVAPQPSRKIKAIAGELAALAVEQKKERTEIEQLRAEVARLRAEPLQVAYSVSQEHIDNAVEQAREEGREEGRREGLDENNSAAFKRGFEQCRDITEAKISHIRSEIVSRVAGLGVQIEEYLTFGEAIDVPEDSAPETTHWARTNAGPVVKAPVPRAPKLPRSPTKSPAKGSSDLSSLQRKILTALVQFGPLTRDEMGLVLCLRPDNGNFGNSLSELNTSGKIQRMTDGKMQATPAGKKALGSYTPLPRPGRELIAAWREKFKGLAQRQYDLVDAAGNKGISRQELGVALGVRPDNGNFGNNLSALKYGGLGPVIDSGSGATRRFSIHPMVRGTVKPRFA